jgi:hypothetical protein
MENHNCLMSEVLLSDSLMVNLRFRGVKKA